MAYACAYPLGVVGIIVSAIIIRIIFRVNLAEEDKAWEADEADKNEAPSSFYVEVVNDFLHGQTIQSIRQFINRPFVCARIQSPGGPIRSPGPDTEVFKGDILRIVSESEHKAGIVAFFG